MVSTAERSDMLLRSRVRREGKGIGEMFANVKSISQACECLFASLLRGEQLLTHLPPSDHAIFISFFSTAACGYVGLRQQQ